LLSPGICGVLAAGAVIGVVAVIVAGVAFFSANRIANPIMLVAAGATRLAVGDAELTGDGLEQNTPKSTLAKMNWA